MVYKVLQIEEDIDFGCEERSEDSPVMAVLTLEDEQGNVSKIKYPDDLLYEKEIDEGVWVSMEEKEIKKR